ncbi:hypothetical protein BH20VER1_BH20VER1_16040 [soil metagenome]
MREVCGIRGHLAFVQQSGPFVRDIFATVALPPGLDGAALEAPVRQTFESESFVRVVEGSPHVSAVAGSNFAGCAERRL